MSPLSHYESSHGAVCFREQRKTASGLGIVCAIGFQKIFDHSGTIVILLHLINSWQMNLDRKPTLLAASLLSACIFALTAAHADEQQAKDVTAAKPGTVFRDCSDCPEMVVIPAQSFIMGSPESEKIWSTKHRASPESVSDEAPEHRVTLRSFALGKYDAARAEYAIFVRETGYPPGEGCGKDSFKWNKQPDLNWKNTGFNQTDCTKAPIDGTANRGPNGCMRVDRGSCWLYPSWLLRSATRERNPADFRDVIMGFRIAKTLA
jgi:formylglycine-generating enzyme required for sulfatase activity